MSQQPIQLVYDRQCPACEQYARLVNIRQSLGELELINARDESAVMDEISAAGFDIDEGMVLKLDGRLYHGADAMHMMAIIGTRAGWFNRLNRWLFSSRAFSHAAYPILRAGRNLLLKLRGVTRINNLRHSPAESSGWLKRTLFMPVDAASVAVFRMGFGLIMLLDALGHLRWVQLDAMYVQPPFMFRYYGFEWVPLLRGDIYTLYVVIAIASLGIIFGLFYRVSALVVAVGTAWIFLQDQSQYLNHIYLLCLYAGLMVFIPAHRYWSLEARFRPALYSPTLPSWCRLALVLQIEIILIYAGLVKLNPDWLALEPLGSWLAKRADMPLFGALFIRDWAVAVAAYGIIVVHLVGAPLLLWKKTRLAVIVFYACFHVLNHFVFDIGVFPWVTLFASLICFDPDWPRQVFAWLKRQSYVAPQLKPIAPPAFSVQAVIAAVFSVWLSYQLLMPARNVAYAGDVAWNEQGHRFAWRMKLRSKQGEVRFRIIDPRSGMSYVLNPNSLLRGRQIYKMPCQPDMILQMAHHYRDVIAPERFKILNAEVYAEGICSLNYRRPATLINPEVDLAQIERHLGNNDWILPLDVPLDDRRDYDDPRLLIKERS